MKKIFFLLFATALIKAQTIRKYSNEFLNIGVGARGQAMAGAVLSNQNDVYAPMWNPAGLASLDSKKGQFAIMHAEYFESIAKYDYIGYAKSLEEGGSFGISLVRFGVDDILNTTQLIDNQGNIDYSKITKFSQADYAGLVTYAFSPSWEKNLKIGLNAKLIYRNVGDFAQAFGFGFDLGGIYEFPKKWKLGFNLRDAISTINFWSVNQKKLSTIVNDQELNPVPKDKIEVTMPKLNFGISRDFSLSENMGLLPEVGLNVDFTKTRDIISSDLESISPYFGAEFRYQNLLFIRLGVNRFQNVNDIETMQKKVSFQPSAGLGIHYKGITLDYALTNSGLNDSNFFSNFFSLKIDLDKFSKSNVENTPMTISTE